MLRGRFWERFATQRSCWSCTCSQDARLSAKRKARAEQMGRGFGDGCRATPSTELPELRRLRPPGLMNCPSVDSIESLRLRDGSGALLPTRECRVATDMSVGLAAAEERTAVALVLSSEVCSFSVGTRANSNLA